MTDQMIRRIYAEVLEVITSMETILDIIEKPKEDGPPMGPAGAQGPAGWEVGK